jgi:hypothetical protein
MSLQNAGYVWCCGFSPLLVGFSTLRRLLYERRKVLATRASKRKFKPLLLLLLIPFIALCWPPFYNFRDPELAGVPFFYWFQLLWIVITAIITAVVYLLDA